MNQLKSIFGLLLILVGGFVLYKVFPAYWGDYKLGRLLEDQALSNTYTTKSESDIAAAVAEKATALDVPLTPEEVTVQRGAGDLTITAQYTVHVDLPLYPLDLNFKTASKNKNVMAK
jgi:hypothetical protein